MADAIRIHKSTLIIIVVAVIIAILLSYFIFKYLPEQSKNKEIQEYKKALFDSILCQYSCQLSLQEFQNKTQMLPEASCVQNCTQALRDNQAQGEKFSNQEISSDNLILDIQNIVDNCRTENSQNISLNVQTFFPCVSGKLGSLKSTYTYLQ